MSWLKHLFTGKKKRHQQVAASMEMSYYRDADSDTLRELQQFALFQKGKPEQRHIRHFMHQFDRARRADCYVFDFRFNRHGQIRHQTVFWALSEELRLPWFSMEPQQFKHTFIKILGREEIKFEMWPSFDRNYWIEGVDPKAVRYVFGEDVPRLFSRELGWIVEGFGNQFVMYKPNKRVAPEMRPELLRLGRSVHDLLLPRAKGNLV